MNSVVFIVLLCFLLAGAVLAISRWLHSRLDRREVRRSAYAATANGLDRH